MGYAHRFTGKRQLILSDIDPNEDAGLKRPYAERETAKILDELVVLQELMYAVQSHSVLVILQGRDTSGKDGTIRKVAGPLSFQSCSVSSFKAPTENELAHDFLWRIHTQAPARGHFKIFNRSHFEDVLVARVHELVPKKIWRGRYDHINHFEKRLEHAGTIVLKFYLHIGKEEQKQRLLDREREPVKSWKLSVGDWEERENWDKYTAAYEDAINNCGTKHAPWFVVPANKKWFRNLAVAEALRDTLLPYQEGWSKKLEKLGKERRKAVEEYRESVKGSQGL